MLLKNGVPVGSDQEPGEAETPSGKRITENLVTFGSVLGRKIIKIRRYLEGNVGANVGVVVASYLYPENYSTRGSTYRSPLGES